MADLATAYVQLVPSLKGAQKTIEGELAGISGERAGGAIGDSMGEGLMGKLGGIASKAAKVLAGAFTAKKVFDFGKAAFDAYADFEQLSGGVEKLFGDAADTVQAHADAAFANMGLSANEYMSQVTSFSAALISDLGGDTAKAAEAADKAMTSMADNASIFGSDVQSIQNAYQGFAKQNYTMLDNLKLGYGGTKSEMERLIADANKYAAETGKAADLSIDSFADVVEAIDLVQQKQGVAGNAAKEASKTLAGSIAATKAAWQNLVTEFGKPDADIGARIGDMFKAVMGENGEGGMLRNVVKEVGVIARNMIGAVADGIGSGFDWLLANGPKLARDALNRLAMSLAKAGSVLGNFDIGSMLGDGGDLAARVQGFFGEMGASIAAAWPNVVSAIRPLIAGIGNFITTNGPQILQALGTVLGSIGNWLLENGPTIIGKVAEAWYSLVEWVTAHGPEIVDKVAEIVGNVVNTAWQWLVTNGPKILLAVGQILMNIATAILDHGPEILGNIAETIGAVLGYVGDAATDMLPKAVEFMGGLLTGTSQEGEKLREWFAGLPQMLLDALGDLSTFLVDAGKQILQGFWDGLTAKWDEVTGWVEGIGDWIAENKGPKAYDLALLVPNGEWIMEGLQAGIEAGVPQLQRTLEGVTGSMQAAVSATYSAPATQQARPAAPVAGGWSEVTEAIGGLRGDMGHLGIYLDGNALVGGISARMDRALVM